MGEPRQPTNGNAETLREHAYGHISELLASGQLRPGDKLSLRTAAVALGMSVMPVREAVSRLIADRALEVTPNRAVRVPVMTRAEFRELTKARLAIEGHAAEEAAQHRTRSGLERIEAAERRFRNHSLAGAPDLAEAVELNSRFHFAVYEAARSPTLVQIIRGLWLKAGPVITLDVRKNPARLASSSALRHADILAAIRARDGARARESLATDITSAANY